LIKKLIGKNCNSSRVSVEVFSKVIWLHVLKPHAAQTAQNESRSCMLNEETSLSIMRVVVMGLQLQVTKVCHRKLLLQSSFCNLAVCWEKKNFLNNFPP